MEIVQDEAQREVESAAGGRLDPSETGAGFGPTPAACGQTSEVASAPAPTHDSTAAKDSRAAPTRRWVTGKEPRDAAAHKRALAGEHGGEPLAKKPCGPEARTTRDDALFTIGSTDPGNSLDCDWVLRELSAFEGASVAEASDDLGCALVSVNRVLETNGHPAFTADEVQRAHADATSAITTDASQVRTAEEASAYIGNPEDGGAMSLSLRSGGAIAGAKRGAPAAAPAQPARSSVIIG